MSFVEMLEFVGRFADIRFKNIPLSGRGLAWKIESFLEDFLPKFGLKKNDVKIQQEDISESDDDY
jgi:hypothetical protein